MIPMMVRSDGGGGLWHRSTLVVRASLLGAMRVGGRLPPSPISNRLTTTDVDFAELQPTLVIRASLHVQGQGARSPMGRLPSFHSRTHLAKSFELPTPTV
jgi:hypothetical protein